MSFHRAECVYKHDYVEISDSMTNNGVWIKVKDEGGSSLVCLSKEDSIKFAEAFLNILEELE